MTEKYHPLDKEEVYGLIRETIDGLGRSDKPRSYGVVPHLETGRPRLYFDLFRISPLQFNVELTQDDEREAIIERVRREIKRRFSPPSATIFSNA